MVLGVNSLVTISGISPSNHAEEMHPNLGLVKSLLWQINVLDCYRGLASVVTILATFSG
jgi:hypothetical protein